MRTHRAISGYLPPSISRLHFRLVHPLPLFRRFIVGAAIEKNFFWFLFFWFSLVSLRSLDWNYFFEFYTRYSYLEIFFIFSKHCFNSSSFHSVFLISFYLFSFYTRLITILSLLRIVENYDFDIISRFRISDSEFRLVSALSILCFDSSTLYLFNSSACYKQTFMLMRVCFMLILAILRLSDVFSFVLGVVYRLGIK